MFAALIPARDDDALQTSKRERAVLLHCGS